jgi:FAD/FMN-containing dehydrogenase
MLHFFCRAKLEAFLLRSMEDGLVADGVIAQDISQASSFWRIREVIICLALCVIFLFS